MNYREEMDKILAQHESLALATSVDHQPNVRIVNFVSLEEQPGVLFFASFPDNEKVKEFEVNDQVAFTSIPQGKSTEHVRAKAQVKRSEKTIFDMKDAFVSKIDGYEQTIEMAGEALVLFELHFSEARVVIDIEHMGNVKL